MGDAHIYPASIISGKIASGIIGGVHIANQSLISANFGANIIATPHIANQGILSASFGANIIATPHIANQGLLSASFGALAIGGAHVANQGLVSANFASGIIGDSLIENYGITSGKYASGSIFETALTSGISIDIAEMSIEPNYKAQFGVSGYLAVQFSVSGYFSWAQAYNVSSVPAVGVTTANIASGQTGSFLHKGRLANAGWNFSGYAGNLVFVGTSSDVTLMVSGLMISGACVQRIGKVVGADTVFVNPDMMVTQIAG